MINLFELLYNFFSGKNKKETIIAPVVEVQDPLPSKKGRKSTKKKTEK